MQPGGLWCVLGHRQRKASRRETPPQPLLLTELRRLPDLPFRTKRDERGRKAFQRVPQQETLQCWWLVMCSCYSVLPQSKVVKGGRLSYFWYLLSVLIAFYSTDEHQDASWDAIEPRPLHGQMPTTCTLERGTSLTTLSINDSSPVKLVNVRGKMANCVCKVYQHTRNRRKGILNECAVRRHVKQWDTEQGEAAAEEKRSEDMTDAGGVWMKREAVCGMRFRPH